MYDYDPKTLATLSRHLLLAAALIAAAACAGSPSPNLPGRSFGPGATAGAASLGPAAAAPAADPVGSTAAVEAIEKALPHLRGASPAQQLQNLRWMLSVGDDRRLVVFFDDLREQRTEPLDRRAAEARLRLEDLASGLERAGLSAAEPAAEVARIDPNAPAPNYFPPAVIEELKKRQDDPEAARLLEEALRTSPRGTRPPGR